MQYEKETIKRRNIFSIHYFVIIEVYKQNNGFKNLLTQHMFGYCATKVLRHELKKWTAFWEYWYKFIVSTPEQSRNTLL